MNRLKQVLYGPGMLMLIPLAANADPYGSAALDRAISAFLMLLLGCITGCIYLPLVLSRGESRRRRFLIRFCSGIIIFSFLLFHWYLLADTYKSSEQPLLHAYAHIFTKPSLITLALPFFWLNFLVILVRPVRHIIRNKKKTDNNQ